MATTPEKKDSRDPMSVDLSKQSKEERAAMKNAARSHRSIKARELLAKLIHDQHNVDVDPSKLTSTKYNREIGWKFVPLDEQNYQWPFISTSQISSQDLGMLEAALSNGKVNAVKDDMYSAAAAFRSRSSRPSHPTEGRGSQDSTHEPRMPGPEDSRLSFLAEASSSQPWASPQQWSHHNHMSQQRETLESQASAASAAANPPVQVTPTDNMQSNFSSSPPNTRKRPYPFEDRVDALTLASPIHAQGESFIRIKVPRTSISEILEREAQLQVTRIRELESKVLDAEDELRRQSQELLRYRSENERLRKELSLRGNDELERLRQENEHLKALGRKLFE